MIVKKNWRRNVLAFVLAGILVFSSFPATAQDIVTSSDIASGSSVFVFRVSRKANQKKNAFVSTSRAKRSVAQRSFSRRNIIRQSNAVAKANQKQRPTKRIDPQTLAKAAPQIKTMPKEQAANILAGAGEYYLERNELERATGFFKEATTLDKTNKFASQGLSDAYTRTGNDLLEKEETEKARFFFEEAVKFDDKNSTAYAGLGEVFDTLEQNKEAIANYEKALSLNSELTEIYSPIGILYYQEGEIAKAENYLTKALAANPNDSATQYFLGLVRYKQNRFEEAQTALERSITLDAQNAEAHYYLGEVYDKLNRQNEAIAAYQKAIQINPKYTEAFFDLGVAFYNQERYQDSVDAYKKVTTLKNDNWEAHANLADAYRQMNKLNEAAASYQIAVSRIKDNAELFSKYGYVMGSLGKWNGAIENLNKAVAISPDPTDYTNLGWAYYNAAQNDRSLRYNAEAQTKLQKGKEALEKAVQTNPRFAAALLNLGVVNNELKDYRSAISVLEKAADLADNKNVKLLVYNEQGISYYGLNDFEKAAKAFRKAIEMNDRFAAAHYSLGEVEYKRGNKKEAEKQLDKLQKLGATGLANRLKLILLGAVPR